MFLVLLLREPQYALEGAAILLKPVCSQLSTLYWELHRGLKTDEPTEEVQP
jgi:hypothetical protein